MVEDIAKEMGVEAVPVETTWASCVLDFQSNKTDLQFGLGRGKASGGNAL